MFNKDSNPILYTIAESIEKLMVGHTRRNQNYKKAVLFDNAAFTLGLRSRLLLNQGTWGHNDAANTLAQYAINYGDVYEQNGTLKAVFRDRFGIQARSELENNFKKIFNAANTRYGNNGAGSEQFSDFILRTKKGSNIFRKLLADPEIEHVPHNIVKFSDNTDTVIGIEVSRKLNVAWKNGLLSSTTRMFAYKLYNNILGYNTVLSHFVPGRGRNCTFCDIGENPWIEDETPLHMFFDCSHCENLRKDFFETYLGYFITRQEFFAFPSRNNIEQNKVVFILALLFKKYIWECKQRFSLPVLLHLQNFIKNEMRIMCFLSNKFKNAMTNSDLPLNFVVECTQDFD
jgi:hypothetical protein